MTSIIPPATSDSSHMLYQHNVDFFKPSVSTEITIDLREIGFKALGPRNLIQQLETALSESDKTRVRLLDLLCSQRLPQEGVEYIFSVLSPIPAQELLSTDLRYKYAIDCALTFGSYIAPLLVLETGRDIPVAEPGPENTALRFLVDVACVKSPDKQSKIRACSKIMEKVLINMDSPFREAFINLERKILDAQLVSASSSTLQNTPTVQRALSEVLTYLPITPKQRYLFLRSIEESSE